MSPADELQRDPSTQCNVRPLRTVNGRVPDSEVRILAAAYEVRERRNQLRHPAYTNPELLATGPNQVWSWDIRKLRGPKKWQHKSQYFIMDIFSRYVVGWAIAERESAELPHRLIEDTLRKHQVSLGQLVISCRPGRVHAVPARRPTASRFPGRGYTLLPPVLSLVQPRTLP